MIIYGSIGTFIRNIDLFPGEIAFLRAAIGSMFLIGVSFFFKQQSSYKFIKKNILLLILSGTALGINWIFLFQAYEYTSIANATLSYYFAPLHVIVLASFILKEKLTPFRIGCVLAAMLGLSLIVMFDGDPLYYSYNHIPGIAYGLLASVFYASVILMNKFIKSLSGFATTLVQLMCAALVLLPYAALKDGLGFLSVSPTSIFLVLTVGIIHTGIAYLLFFSAIKDLKGQTIAVMSYIDPISAVIIAAIFLGESMSFIQITGGIFILGSTFLSEKFAPN